MDEREVVLFCDLHGHSRKAGIFVYGCERVSCEPCLTQCCQQLARNREARATCLASRLLCLTAFG